MTAKYRIEKRFPFYLLIEKNLFYINDEPITTFENIIGIYFTKSKAHKNKVRNELRVSETRHNTIREVLDIIKKSNMDNKVNCNQMRRCSLNSQMYVPSPPNIATKTERRPAPMNNCFIDEKTNIENATDEILQVLNKYNLTVFQRDAVFQKVNDYINNHTYINAK